MQQNFPANCHTRAQFLLCSGVCLYSNIYFACLLPAKFPRCVIAACLSPAAISHTKHPTRAHKMSTGGVCAYSEK